MKRLLLLIAVLLAACSSTPTAPNLDTLAANAKIQITQACAVVQPTLVDLNASIPNDPNLKTAVQLNGQFCNSVQTLDVVNAQTMINTMIPGLITAVGLLPVDPATQVSIKIALGAASIALSNWLLVYGQQPNALPTVTK